MNDDAAALDEHVPRTVQYSELVPNCRLEKVVHPQSTSTQVARSAFVSLSRCLEPAVLRCQSSSAFNALFLLLNRWKLYALSSEQCSSFVVTAASLLRALTDEYSTRPSSADHLLRTKLAGQSRRRLLFCSETQLS